MDEASLKGKTLLVVDDETDLRDIVASELEFIGAKVFQAGNVAQAKEFLNTQKIDLIISDIRMPGGTGIDLLQFVKSRNPNSPAVILITGFADFTAEDVYNMGAEAFMYKPFKLDDFIQTVSNFIRPASERFSDTEAQAKSDLHVDFEEELGEKITKKECSIGRGGISFLFDSKGNKIDQGEPLAIKLKFKDQEINGIAICRWIHHLGKHNRVGVGMEFIELETQTLHFFIKYLEKKVIVPYIPLL